MMQNGGYIGYNGYKIDICPLDTRGCVELGDLIEGTRGLNRGAIQKYPESYGRFILYDE